MTNTCVFAVNCHRLPSLLMMVCLAPFFCIPFWPDIYPNDPKAANASPPSVLPCNHDLTLCAQQDFAEFEAKLAALQKSSPRRGIAQDMETLKDSASRVSRATNLADRDNGKKKSGGGGRGDVGNARSELSFSKKRPRDTTRQQSVGTASTFSDGNKRLSSRTASCGRPSVVLAFLECEDWEVERAKLLCRALGQHRLYTSLVQGVTHVVIGSQHSLDAREKIVHDGDEDGNSDYSNRGERRGRRHELVKHGIVGYLEAVMLGLWVLDFSWVRACLEKLAKQKNGSTSPENTGRGGSNAGGGRMMDSNRNVKLSALPPTRGFEIVGCIKKHTGCDARRGRRMRAMENTGAGSPRIFDGYAFHILTGIKEQRNQSQQSASREEARLMCLLELGGGSVLTPMQTRPTTPLSSTQRNASKRELWLDNPFDLEDISGSSDGKESSPVPAARQGRINEKCSSRVEKVIVAVADRSDGEVSPRTALAVLEFAKTDIPAVSATTPAVSEAWVLRSIERGSRVDVQQYSIVTRSKDVDTSARSPLLRDKPDAGARDRLQQKGASDKRRRSGEGKHDGVTEQRRGPGRLQLRDKNGDTGWRDELVVLDRKRRGRNISPSPSPSQLRVRPPVSAAQRRSDEIMAEAARVIAVGEKLDKARALRDAEAKAGAAARGDVNKTGPASKGFEFTRVGEKKQVHAKTVSIASWG